MRSKGAVAAPFADFNVGYVSALHGGGPSLSQAAIVL